MIISKPMIFINKFKNLLRKKASSVKANRFNAFKFIMNYVKNKVYQILNYIE